MYDYLTPECDNKVQAHRMVEIEGKRGARAFCTICRRTFYLRTNKNGAPDKKLYAKLFYRDIVQRNKPLFYKFHREYMNIRDIV